MRKYLTIGLAVVVVAWIVITVAVVHGHNNKTVTIKTVGSYVALGDSVAAGVGLTSPSDASACDRTNQAYPNLVATRYNYKLTSVACSGATLSSGILGKQDVNNLQITPQLQQLFTQPMPKLITITIGANDAGWTQFITKCYTGECGSPEDSALVAARVSTVSTNLQTMLSQLQQHYGATLPKVVVAGYYQVFPTGVSSCADLTNIDANEITFGRQTQTAINDALQSSSAKYSFTMFVPISFSGHELCTSNSWVQGLNDSEPYHPTEAGQSAIAKQVEAAIK